MTTQARALDRINRIAEATCERDADHFESEAMGYLAALHDEGLLHEVEYARLMNALRTQRMTMRELDEARMRFDALVNDQLKKK